jgi:hypothetical protein
MILKPIQVLHEYVDGIAIISKGIDAHYEHTLSVE